MLLTLTYCCCCEHKWRLAAAQPQCSVRIGAVRDFTEDLIKLYVCVGGHVSVIAGLVTRWFGSR